MLAGSQQVQAFNILLLLKLRRKQKKNRGRAHGPFVVYNGLKREPRAV